MVWIRSADIYSVVHNNGIPLVVQPGMQGLRVYRVQVRTVKFLGFPVGLPQNMTPVALSKQKPEESIVCSLVVTCWPFSYLDLETTSPDYLSWDFMGPKE